MLFVYQTPRDKIFLGRVGADSNSRLISPGFSQLSNEKRAPGCSRVYKGRNPT